MSTETAAGVQRRIRQARVFRAAFAALTVPNALMLAVDVATGSFAALIAVVSLAFCVLMTVRNTRRIGALRLRERELARPRMTLEDYRRLREMELELGWEPSELPAGWTPPATVTGTITASGGAFSAMASLSGSGSLSAKATWDDVAYASEASEHFAQLARVGRESCISPCRMCEERWLETERWGGNEH